MGQRWKPGTDGLEKVPIINGSVFNVKVHQQRKVLDAWQRWHIFQRQRQWRRVVETGQLDIGETGKGRQTTEEERVQSGLVEERRERISKEVKE